MVSLHGQESIEEGRMTDSGWGGARPGAGRPLKDDEKRKTYSFSLLPTCMDRLEKVTKGKGLSKSQALERLLQRADIEALLDE
ncbi:hypothetical protein D3C72_2380980 [compost metagenome]